MELQKLIRLKNECERNIKGGINPRCQFLEDLDSKTYIYLTTKGYTIHILTLEEFRYLNLKDTDFKEMNLFRFVEDIEDNYSLWKEDIIVDKKYCCSKYNLYNCNDDKFIESFYINKTLLKQFMKESKNHKIVIKGSAANKPFKVFHENETNYHYGELELLGYIFPVRYHK